MNVYWILDSIDYQRDRHSSGVVSQARAFSSLDSQHKFFVGTTGKSQESCSLFSLSQTIRKLINNYQVRKGSYAEDNFQVFLRPFSEFRQSGLQDYEKKIIRQHLSVIQGIEKKEGKIDLLHAHTGLLTGGRAYELSKILNIPYIITEHYSGFLRGSTGYSDIHKRMDKYAYVYHNAQAVTAVSLPLKNALESFGIQNVSCIPNPVFPAFFSEIFDTKPRDNFLFFTIGRLHFHKGFDILFQAIFNLKEQGFFKEQKCHFYIGGASASAPGYVHESEYNKMLQNLQIQDYVTFLGYLTQQEAQQWYDKTHAYILPSRVETFGIPPVEAMVRGRPVIATRCGGPQDYVTEVNGLLVEPNSSKELSRAIEKMVTTYEQYDPQVIRESIRPLVEPKVVFKKILDVYKRAILHKRESF